MGYRAISAVLNHSKAVGNTRLVLLAIAHFYDEVGNAGSYPSQETIAKLAACSTRSVRRAIRELVELEEIEVFTHAGRGHSGDRQTNRYYVLLDCQEGCLGDLNHRTLKDKHDTTRGQTRQDLRTNTTGLKDNVVRLSVINN